MKKIYLSGGITGVPEEEANKWRDDLEDKLYSFDVFNPMAHFDEYELKSGAATDREIMEYEIHMLRHSDVVIYNCHYPKSIGSAMELAIAYENRIPIVLLNEDLKYVHPWIEEMSLRSFDNTDDLVTYIRMHFS